MCFRRVTQSLYDLTNGVNLFIQLKSFVNFQLCIHSLNLLVLIWSKISSAPPPPPSAEYLDKLTITAENGKAFEATYGNDNWAKTDIRIFSVDTQIESKTDTAVYVGGNPDDVLNAFIDDEADKGSAHSDFAIEDLETDDASVNEA